MKKIINIQLLVVILISSCIISSCLKSNPYYEDFSSTQPIADIPKAAANAITAAAPTSSWEILDTLAGGVDYLTAIHISYKDHIGDQTVHVIIDKTAAQTWIANHATAGYTLIPDSLFTVPTTNVLIPNAGVFSTGDFKVHINTKAKNSSGVNVFKANKFILPVSIDTVLNQPYRVASNYRTVLWYIRVK